MSEVSRSEVKEMIENAVENKFSIIRTEMSLMKGEIGEEVKKGLDNWAAKYELKPDHWVYLKYEYQKALGQQTMIRRLIITALVTACIAGSLGLADRWITEKAVQGMKRAPTTEQP